MHMAGWLLVHYEFPPATGWPEVVAGGTCEEVLPLVSLLSWPRLETELRRGRYSESTHGLGSGLSQPVTFQPSCLYLCQSLPCLQASVN